MHDIRLIRETPEAFDAGLARRNLAPLSSQILALDAASRAVTTRLQEMQARRNEASKLIGQAKAKKDEAAAAEPAGPAERTVAADAEADAPFDDDVPAAPAKSRARLSVDVDELPSDLADAFEQFKLAIIAQRRLGWSETTPEAVIECLDALKTLVLAPGDD
jgi:hypothetical protein